MRVKFSVAAGSLALAASAVFLIVGCDASNEQGSTASKPQSDKTQATLNTDAGEAKIIGVDAVAKSPKAHAGRVAIEGVVAQVMAAQGAFTIIDTTEFAACGRTDCAEYSVPVLVPKSEFKGDLPKHKETVVAIGEVQPLEKGFRFVVQEVRRKDAAILSRTKAPSAEQSQLVDCLPKTLLANKDELRLTPDQISKLTAIQESLTEAREPLQKKLTHCQEELVELLEQKLVDQAKVDHEKKETIELKSKLLEEQGKAEKAARAVLTPDQLKKVPEAQADPPC